MDVDPTTMQVALGAGVGIVGVPFIVYRIMQALKDLFPGLRDERARWVVYGISALTATLLLIAIGAYTRMNPTPEELATAALAWIVFTGGIAEIAKGYYSNDFKVSVSGLPPAPDASAPLAAVTTDNDVSTEELPVYTDAAEAVPVSQTRGRRGKT